jgi:predicted PurR-regulated permease PerM
MKSTLSKERPDPRAAVIFTVLASAFLLWQILHLASPFLQPIFWAAVLAIAFYPLYRKLCALCHGHETRAAAILTLLIVLITVPVFVIGVVKAAEEMREITESTEQFIEDGTFKRETQRFFSYGWVHRQETAVFGPGALEENILRWSRDLVKNAGKFAARHAAAVTKSLVVTTAKFAVMLFVLFFFLRDGERFCRYIVDLIPLEKRHKEKVLAESWDVTQAVVQGIFAVAILKGIIAAVLFLATGILYAPLLGAATFVSSFLPFIGAAAVWLPVGLSLLFQGDYNRAIVVFTVGGIVINSVDNILQPILVGKKTKLPFALLMLAMLGGVLVYGLAGLFIGPLVLALFLVFAPIYREKIFRARLPKGSRAERTHFPQRLAG